MIKCRLKDILKASGMTQKELCDHIGARPSTICDLCNNNSLNVKLSLIEDICRALDCQISDIFTLK